MKTAITVVILIFFSSRYTNGLTDDLIGLPVDYDNTAYDDSRFLRDWDLLNDQDVWNEQLPEHDDGTITDVTLKKLCEKYDLSLNDRTLDCEHIKLIQKSLKIENHLINKREAEAEAPLDEGSGDGAPEASAPIEAIKVEPTQVAVASAATAPAETALKGSPPPEPAPNVPTPAESAPEVAPPAESAPQVPPPAGPPKEAVPPTELPHEGSPLAEPTHVVPLVHVVQPAHEAPPQAEPTHEVPPPTQPAHEAPPQSEPTREVPPPTQPAHEELPPTGPVHEGHPPAPQGSLPAEPAHAPTESKAHTEWIPSEQGITKTVTSAAGESPENSKPEVTKEGAEKTPETDKKESDSKPKEPVVTEKSSSVSEGAGSEKAPKKLGTGLKEQEDLNDQQSGNALVNNFAADGLKETDDAVGKMKPNANIKSASIGGEEPKSGESTTGPSSSGKDTKILIFLFGAVLAVGAAAFAYNYVKKRKRATLSRTENGIDKSDPEEGKEMKPLMKNSEQKDGAVAVEVEYNDEK